MGVKVEKKNFDEKLAAGWSRGFPLEGKPMTFFENFFLRKIVNSKLYFTFNFPIFLTDDGAVGAPKRASLGCQMDLKTSLVIFYFV